MPAGWSAEQLEEPAKPMSPIERERELALQIREGMPTKAEERAAHMSALVRLTPEENRQIGEALRSPGLTLEKLYRDIFYLMGAISNNMFINLFGHEADPELLKNFFEYLKKDFEQTTRTITGAAPLLLEGGTAPGAVTVIKPENIGILFEKLAQQGAKSFGGEIVLPSRQIIEETIRGALKPGTSEYVLKLLPIIATPLYYLTQMKLSEFAHDREVAKKLSATHAKKPTQRAKALSQYTTMGSVGPFIRSAVLLAPNRFKELARDPASKKALKQEINTIEQIYEKSAREVINELPDLTEQEQQQLGRDIMKLKPISPVAKLLGL